MKPIVYLLDYSNYCFRLATYYLIIRITRIKIFLIKPWWIARFYASWVEYQSTPVYRERLVYYGLAQAIYGFINSKWEQRYCLKLRLKKEPRLYWRILFLPFSVDIPKDLVRASQEGYFSPEIKFNII